MIRLLVRNLNKVKRQYVNKLKSSLDRDAFDKFKKNSDDVGLDYGTGVHSYGQVHSDDILEHYVEWYSYFDDVVLAEESLRKAEDDSKVWCNIELTEDELKDVVNPDEAEVRDELSKLRKNRNTTDGSDVNW